MNEVAPLWAAKEVIDAVGGQASGDWTATGVSIDSRTISEGDLFVAIEGPKNDGHRYVGDALGRGAVGAIVSRAPQKISEKSSLVFVTDTKIALEALGQAARARSVARIIGVTGSVGKTGTKEALKLVFGEQAKTYANEASYNNQWGVPLSLARLPREARYAIFELGMNHSGELGPLARLVRPHIAIITAVEPVHLEFFENVAAIADAKAEIFSGLEPGGLALLNSDSEYFEHLSLAANSKGNLEVRGFGSGTQAWARLLNVIYHPDSSYISAKIGDEEVVYRVGAAGRHWVANSLAVLGTVKSVDADLSLASMALSRITLPEGRGRRRRVSLQEGSFELIDESYNSNPASVRAALEVLSACEKGKGGRRMAVLGDMLELGHRGSMLHRSLAEEVIAAEIDLVFTAGSLMANLNQALSSEKRGGHGIDAKSIARTVVAAVRPGDVVMVKGSFATRMHEVVEALLALEAPNNTVLNG